MEPGFQVFPSDPQGTLWAQAARARAEALLPRLSDFPGQLRHGETWFVGVDALDTAPDGSVNGVALAGAWLGGVPVVPHLHKAQLSIVFPGYPQQDAVESDAAHRYRRARFAAHLDGIHAEGANKRRYLREPHGFVLGIALNPCDAAPLMVWPGSHRIMGDALRMAIGDAAPDQVDVTETYGAARRQVFDTITPIAVQTAPGQAVLLHRHLLHGIAPWQATQAGGEPCRMVAYFRPVLTDMRAWPADW